MADDRPIRVTVKISGGATRPVEVWRPFRLVIAVFVVLGTIAAVYQLRARAGDAYVGHADQAAYAGMARGMAEGRGLNVDYVSFFFRRYPSTITHLEDHWPPLLPVCITPFFLLFGISAEVARIAPVLIGCIGLPLAAAILGMAYSGRASVALMNGLLILVSPVMFQQSSAILSDLLVATLATTFTASMLLAVRRPWMLILAGAVGGLAFYAKQSELLLGLLYVPGAIVICGIAILRSRWFWMGCAAWLVVVLPWFAVGYSTAGRASFTTQQSIGQYIGLDAWSKNTYGLHWDEPTRPIWDRWRAHADRYWPVTVSNLHAFAWIAFLGADVEPSTWYLQRKAGGMTGQYALEPVGGTASAQNWSVCLRQVIGIAALIECAMVAGALALGRSRGATNTLAWLLLVTVAHGLVLSMLWVPIVRLCFLAMPITAAIGLTAAWERTGWGRRMDAFLTVTMAIVVIGVVTIRRDTLAADLGLAVPERTTAMAQIAGPWLAENCPGAVVMAEGPWELCFHADGKIKAVHVPVANAQGLAAVLDYYRVTHVLLDGPLIQRRLASYIDDQGALFRRVTDAPVPLYLVEKQIEAASTARSGSTGTR